MHKEKFSDLLDEVMAGRGTDDQVQEVGEALLESEDARTEAATAYLLRDALQQQPAQGRRWLLPVAGMAAMVLSFSAGLMVGDMDEQQQIDISVSPSTIPSVTRGTGVNNIAPIIQATAAGTAVVLPVGRCNDVRSVKVTSKSGSSQWTGESRTGMVVLNIPAKLRGMIEAIVSFGNEGCSEATYEFSVGDGAKDESDDSDPTGK
ncbi:MAG: hypothetical protein DHS20C11_18220 [Lysobacteraceae bacterium]|nr:MAG: hypothetical protein DHS20C11_18220 [Xanthomonadaceae bacterium]